MPVKNVRRAVRGLARVPNQALARELARRQKVASQLEAKRTRLLAQVADLDAEIRDLGGSVNGTAKRGRRGPHPRNSQTLPEALAALLKGKTMSVTDAAQAVQKAGYKTRSANFRIQVNAALINGPFRRVGRGQYTSR